MQANYLFLAEDRISELLRDAGRQRVARSRESDGAATMALAMTDHRRRPALRRVGAQPCAGGE